MSNVHTETPAPRPPGQKELRACLQSLLVVSVSLPRQSSLGSLGPVLSSSSVGLLQALLGVLGTQPPTPRTALRHSAQASPVRALAVARLHPRSQRSVAEAGVGGKPVQKSRLQSICFLSTVCRELPMGGSCRKVWGARPHADLQGPEAGTATLSGQGRPTDSGPSWGGILPFQEPFLVIELASPREGELGTMRVQAKSALSSCVLGLWWVEWELSCVPKEGGETPALSGRQGLGVGEQLRLWAPGPRP